MKPLALLLLLCASCAAPLVLQPPTRERLVRDASAAQLRSCLFDSNNWPEYVQRCYREDTLRCKRDGLEAGCGRTELQMRCLTSSDTGEPGSVPGSARCAR